MKITRMITQSNNHEHALTDYFRDVIATVVDEGTAADAQLMVQLIAYVEQQPGPDLHAFIGHMRVTFVQASVHTAGLYVAVWCFQQRFTIEYDWILSLTSPWPRAMIRCHADTVDQTGQAICRLVGYSRPPKRLRIAELLEVGTNDAPTLANVIVPYQPAPLCGMKEKSSGSLERYYNHMVQQGHPLFSEQACLMLRLLPLLEKQGVGQQYWARTEHTDLSLCSKNQRSLDLQITPLGSSTYAVSFPLVSDDVPCESAWVRGETEDVEVAARMVAVAITWTRTE